MREEPQTREEMLADVHKLAAEAAWWRARLLKVMRQARRSGVPDEQIAEASELSVDAVQALLDRRPR